MWSHLKPEWIGGVASGCGLTSSQSGSSMYQGVWLVGVVSPQASGSSMYQGVWLVGVVPPQARVPQVCMRGCG